MALVIGAWPFHGVVAGCANAIAFARAWVPVFLWLGGVCRASPVQDLAYRPQHSAPCIAPERGRERVQGLEFGRDRQV
jgi:hypothetical protein